MNTRTVVLAVALLSTAAAPPNPIAAPTAVVSDVPRVATNDNRHSAGSLRDGKLELKLVATEGRWFPEAEEGSSVVSAAFAEEGHAPQIPGPMIRVAAGTQIHIAIRNTLRGEPLVVHGLHARPSGTDDVVIIPTGETKEVSFAAGAPGSYYYWASVGRKPLVEYEEGDARLTGAIIVDGPTGIDPKERVFVIGVWRTSHDSAGYFRAQPREIVVVNGKSWPYTERFTFTQGDTVSWRWVNASNAGHPMHLHGFYYDVESHGAEAVDTVSTPADITHVNTHTLLPGATMAMHFVPDRPGNWLFHCHLALHVDGTSTVANLVSVRSYAEMEKEMLGMHHGITDMAGLIIGFHVTPRGSQPAANALEPQRLRLLVQNSPHGNLARPATGFVLQRGGEPRSDSVAIPGPTLFLEAGRPARVTVVNHLKTETAVHWHGMEIVSYPDGVPGWSGVPGKLMPAIQPNDSFVAEFTPPRAGTFIYHSHMHELLQTNTGMYGPLIVTDSAHRFDPAVDKIILVGGGGPGNVETRAGGMVNGTINPTLQLEAGKTYRLRLIQIHPQAVVLFRLGDDITTYRWTPVAKDGADLSAAQSVTGPSFTMMGAGETADFLYTPERPGQQKMIISTRGPGWIIPLQIFVRPAARVAAR